MTERIIQDIKEFGLNIDHMLEHLTNRELEDIHQAITEFKKNKQNLHPIDYLW